LPPSQHARHARSGSFGWWDEARLDVRVLFRLDP
jgi:hypothetical protein